MSLVYYPQKPGSARQSREWWATRYLQNEKHQNLKESMKNPERKPLESGVSRSCKEF